MKQESKEKLKRKMKIKRILITLWTPDADVWCVEILHEQRKKKYTLEAWHPGTDWTRNNHELNEEEIQWLISFVK